MEAEYALLHCNGGSSYMMLGMYCTEDDAEKAKAKLLEEDDEWGDEDNFVVQKLRVHFELNDTDFEQWRTIDVRLEKKFIF